MNQTHKCLALNCPTKVQNAYLMCGKHWSRVPREIQRTIWATVGKPEKRKEYIAACIQATVEVALKEGQYPDRTMAEASKAVAELLIGESLTEEEAKLIEEEGAI